MDTPSSGSSSKSAKPAEGQQPCRQTTTYTTFGSVLNPQIATQLPPPAQRDRAQRHPPFVPDDITALDQFLQANSPYEFYQPTLPSTATVMREYFPLQQNDERAVGPVARLTPQEQLATEALMDMSKPSTPLYEVPAGDRHIQVPQIQVTPVRDGNVRGEEDSQWSGDIRHHSVKALTNLASYPNRHQKAAQRALDRGREAARPVPTGPAAMVGRPVTPAYREQNMDGPGAQYSSPWASSPWGPADNSQDLHHNFTTTAMATYNNNNNNNNNNNKNAPQSGGLPGGYGPPQPLIAGPPGQRQYKASTLNGPYRAVQNLPPVSFLPTVEESHFEMNPMALADLTTMARSPEHPIKPIAAGMPQPPMPQSNKNQHMMSQPATTPQPATAPAQLRQPGMPQPGMPQPDMPRPVMPRPGVSQTTGAPPGIPLIWRRHPVHQRCLSLVCRSRRSLSQQLPSQRLLSRQIISRPFINRAIRPSPFQCADGYEEVKQRFWTRPIRDTRVVDRVKQYYNGETPPGYNPSACISAPEDNSDLMVQLRAACSRRQQPKEEDVARRNARHKVAFYAGTAEMTKTWDQRFEELRQRVRNKELGISDAAVYEAAREAAIDAALKCDTIGKPNDFDVQIFNDWATHEVMEPLLGMAYSALGKHLCDRGCLTSMQKEANVPQRPEDHEMWACTRGSDPS
ncbi:hypothetical protein OPQ81_000005 [Rhizoctonia solani]|nr:hypothetical protein OPQ81_000005 [Rhizoctonia solani]